MPDDTKIPDTTLPPGLSPVPGDPPPGNTPVIPPVTDQPAFSPASEPPQPQTAQPLPVNPVSEGQPSYRPVDVSTVPSGNEKPAVKEDSTLKDLAKTMMENPPPSESPVSDLPPQVPPQTPPPEPTPPKKSGGKKSTVIGALFLLIVLPILGYYVSRTADITRILQFATGGAYPTIVPTEPPEKCENVVCGPNGECLTPGGCAGCCKRIPTKTPTPTPTKKPTSTPTGTVTSTPTPTGTVTSTPTGTVTSTPTPTVTSTPTPTSLPPEPGECDASCDNDNGCGSGLICASVEGIKRCRNPLCTSEYSCVCPALATPTPTQRIVERVVTATPTEQIVERVVTATPAPIAAAPTPKVPVSGAPAVLGAATVIGGILLLLLGLLL